MATIPQDALPPLAPPWPPGSPGTPPPPITTDPPVRSSLGRIAAWTTLIAVGLLGVVDASGVDVAASAYVAVPLAVVGGALVLGFRYGRSRGLIAVGAVLTVLLGVVGIAESVATAGRNVTWKPAGLAQLDSRYDINIGDATLDLSAVDFNGRSASVDVHVGMGDLTVILPATVDTRTLAEVDVGDVNVLGRQWSGIGQSEHAVTDLGPDGVGGGDLALRATVDVGNLEVRR
jgi:hypothetical protein